MLRLSVAFVPLTYWPEPTSVPLIVMVPLFVSVAAGFTVRTPDTVAMPATPLVIVLLLLMVTVVPTNVPLFTKDPALTFRVVAVRVAVFVNAPLLPTVAVVTVIDFEVLIPEMLLKVAAVKVSRLALEPPTDVGARLAGVSKFRVAAPVTGVAWFELLTKFPVNVCGPAPVANVAGSMIVNVPFTIMAAAAVFAPVPASVRWL